MILVVSVVGFVVPVVAELIPAASGDVRLEGAVGVSAECCICARVRSDWAQGALYNEAVEAFRTHADDRGEYGGWQNEYWGKTMLSMAGAAAYEGDAALSDWLAKKTCKFLDEFQWKNGYLSTYAREDFLRSHPDDPDALQHWCFNIWGQKYTLWALVDLYRVTKDERILAGAVKLADHLVAQLKRLNVTLDKTGSWYGISSMSILRPLLELHRLTGKESYLALAKDIIRALQDSGADPGHILHDAFRKEPIHTWYPKPGFWAKTYETLSCLEGAVDFVRLTGDRKVLEGVLAYYGHLEREEVNAMGSVGHFDHFFGAAEQHNGLTELCDVTHWIRLNRELLLLTGAAKYADAVEIAFYNAFLAGVRRDGRWGAHIVRSHGTRHLWAPPQTGMFHHQCCPDNMLRTYFDIAGTSAAREADGALDVILYHDVRVALGDDRVVVSGGYPWGDVPVSVRISRKAAGKVRFRRPAWAKTFRVNGREAVADGGWCTFDAPVGDSSWTLAFDLSPRVIEAVSRGERLLPSSPQGHSFSDISAFTVRCMELHTPEMAGLCRIAPAVRIMRGPLYLAKGRLAGTSRGDTFATFCYENGGAGWKIGLVPLRVTVGTSGVPRAWRLTMSRGAEEKEFAVSDFASLSNVDDPDSWFSLWF